MIGANIQATQLHNYFKIKILKEKYPVTYIPPQHKLIDQILQSRVVSKHLEVTT